MEPEGSLPCSQQPAIFPYPEPDESIPHSYITVVCWLVFFKWVMTWAMLTHFYVI